jgi:acetyl esterase/lipase
MTRTPSPARRLAAVLAAACLAAPALVQACTPVRLKDGAHGARLCWGDQTWFSKGPHPVLREQTFDFYPSAAGPQAPLIVYFHPDGTTSHIAPGSGADLQILQPALQAGYAFATVEYRHPVDDDDVPNTPDDPRVPHWDAARATQFLRANAGALGFDRRQVFFVGHSRGALSIWTALQPDMADPQSPDPVARESTRVLALFEYQGATTYRDREFAQLFVVRRDRAELESGFETDHPLWPQFGSAIDSADATSPPIEMRYRDDYPGHPISLGKIQTKYSMDHYPGQGPALCEAYARRQAAADCIVRMRVPTEHAFDAYLDFFAAHGLK